MEDCHKLTWFQKMSYGVGHSLNNLLGSMWSSYFIMYMQLILAFHSTTSGMLLLIGQVANAVATPLFGYEVTHNDGISICRAYGKRKFLHLLGTICVVVSAPFIFSVCPGCEYSSENALATMLIPLIIIFQVGWAAVQVSHLSLIPAITPDEKERDTLNALRYTINIVSDMSTYVIVWCVFDLTPKISGDHNQITTAYADKFLLIIVIILVIGCFFSAAFHFGVKENAPAPALGNRREHLRQSTSRSLSWTDWMKEAKFFQVGLLYMFARLYQNMSCVFMPLYLQEFLRTDVDSVAKVPLIMNLTGFFLSCFLPKVFGVLSKRITILVGVGLGVVSCVGLAAGHGYYFRILGIYGVGSVMGAASVILVVSALSFIHDLIGTNIESGAFVYGCMSFCDKLANGIAVMIVQHLHWKFCRDCDTFYKDVISYGVGSMAIAAAIVVLTLLDSNLGKKNSQSTRVPLHQTAPSTNYKSTDNSGEAESLLTVIQEET